MKQLHRYFVLCSSVLLLGCTAQTAAYDYNGLFSIEYPAGWSVVTERNELPAGIEVAFIAPVIDGKTSNIAVSLFRTSGEQTLESVIALAEGELLSYPGLTPIESSSHRISDQKTVLKEFHVTSGDTIAQKVFQTYLLRDGTAYILSATVPGDASEDALASVQDALLSFTFPVVEAAEGTDE